jgi:hypothetical protein
MLLEEEIKMEKSCACGHQKTLRLRSLIYSKKVAIMNVPVLGCAQCGHCEVLPEVAPDLIALLRDLGDKPVEQHIWFNEVNELAYIFFEANRRKRRKRPVPVIVEERINQLLDLLLLAQSLQNSEWVADVETRLTQISKAELMFNNTIQ